MMNLWGSLRYRRRSFQDFTPIPGKGRIDPLTIDRLLCFFGSLAR